MAYGTINVDSVTTSSGQILGAGNATGFKNRIINGAGMVDQRNAGAAQIGVSSGAYIVDRFSFSTSQNGKWNLQQLSVSDLAGFTKAAYVTIGTTYTTGVSDYAIVDHKIEGLNVADLAWGTSSAKTVTLSFNVKTNVPGTYGVTVLNGGATRGYNTTYTVTSSGVWQQVSITIAGDTTGTWATDNSTGIWLRFGLGCGSNYAMSTLNAWGSSFGYQPSGGAVISGNAGGYWLATGVQLEVGSTATSFDVRDYGRELILCQRYLPSFTKTSGVIGGVGVVTSSTNFYPLIPLSVKPRVPPTGVVANAASNFAVTDIASAYIAPTSIAFSSAGFDTAVLAITTSAVLTPFRPTYFMGNDTCILYFTGCEL